jgi:hypothetical protein
MITATTLIDKFNIAIDEVGTVAFPEPLSFINDACMEVFQRIARPDNTRGRAVSVNSFYESSSPISVLLSELVSDETVPQSNGVFTLPARTFLVSSVAGVFSDAPRTCTWVSKSELAARSLMALFAPTECDPVFHISSGSITISPAPDASSQATVSVLKYPEVMDGTSVTQVSLHPSLTNYIITHAAKLATASIRDASGTRLQEEIENG